MPLAPAALTRAGRVVGHLGRAIGLSWTSGDGAPLGELNPSQAAVDHHSWSGYHFQNPGAGIRLSAGVWVIGPSPFAARGSRRLVGAATVEGVRAHAPCKSLVSGPVPSPRSHPAAPVVGCGFSVARAHGCGHR